MNTNGDAADRDAILALKHAYFRLLDLKRFDELGALLTDDVTTAYQSGELAHHGRQAVVTFLSQSLGSPAVVSMHHGHHPEITFESETEASGRWYLEDRVVVAGRDFDLRGTAVYDDRYRRTPDGWRISHTGYERVFEERRRLSTGELILFESRFDGSS